MKLLAQDFRHGTIKIKIENLDDLWALSQLIESGDLVSGRTLRKIKSEQDLQRKSAAIRKAVTLSLKVEKVEFQKYSDTLKVLGTVEEGPEDVPKGSHHSFSLEENSVIKIAKGEWLDFQIKKLKEAASSKTSPILLLVHDREHALFALLRGQGYEVLAEMHGNVQKKGSPEQVRSTFYSDIIKVMKAYAEKYSVSATIAASPAFWKEELIKEISDEKLSSTIVQATVSHVGKQAFDELMNRNELREALRGARLSKEAALAERLLAEISTEGKATYGFQQVKAAAEAGAVDTLLITDRLIQQRRQEGTFQEVEHVMRTAGRARGEIVILNSDFPPGKKLDGLGGIAAILRYKFG